MGREVVKHSIARTPVERELSRDPGGGLPTGVLQAHMQIPFYLSYTTQEHFPWDITTQALLRQLASRTFSSHITTGQSDGGNPSTGSCFFQSLDLLTVYLPEVPNTSGLKNGLLTSHIGWLINSSGREKSQGTISNVFLNLKPIL